MDEIERLAAEVAGCRICRDQADGKPLPHEPRPVFVLSGSAPILIAGQAPGTKVHASGRPFTDRSGDRLREWLGVSSDEFYDPRCFAMLPMGFCFPGQDAKGGDLPPRRECAPAWRRRLLDAMPQIELVLAIGMYAQAFHMGSRAALTETVRNWRAGLKPARAGAPQVLPLPHPSWRNTGWVKQNPWFEAELLPCLREMVRTRLAKAHSIA